MKNVLYGYTDDGKEEAVNVLQKAFMVWVYLTLFISGIFIMPEGLILWIIMGGLMLLRRKTKNEKFRTKT